MRTAVSTGPAAGGTWCWPGTHGTTTTLIQTLTGCPGASQWWQSPHAWLPPLQAPRMAQCSVLPCATAATGKGVLGVTAPSRPRPERGPREGAHPRPGYPGTHGHTGSSRPPPSSRGRGALQDMATAAPAPCYSLARATAWGLFLALHHSPAKAAALLPCTATPARPRVCPRHAGPPRLPVPRASPAPPAPGTAHRSASRRCR